VASDWFGTLAIPLAAQKTMEWFSRIDGTCGSGSGRLDCGRALLLGGTRSGASGAAAADRYQANATPVYGRVASGDVDRWAVLQDAETRLLACLASSGVMRLEYVVGFVEPYEVSVWLGTETDAQREALKRHEGLHEEVGDALTAAGIDDTDAVFRRVVVQSQETVDREYEGRWFYALR
jgi:hypothetical protein